jgi:hypothetical protein
MVTLPLLASDAPPGAGHAPAVPLVTFDPMLSVWSDADQLTDVTTRHWTSHDQPLVSLIRVDGQCFRLMGTTPAGLPALPQRSVVVSPTRTTYEFEGAGVRVTLSFLTPLLPDDLDVFARPVTYLTWTVQSTGPLPHTVSIYDSTSALLSVNKPQELVRWTCETMGPLTAWRTGTEEQNLLGVSGDDARIDWGYVYAVAPTARTTASAGGADETLSQSFVKTGTLPTQPDTRQPRAADDAQPVLAYAFDLGNVDRGPVTRHLMIGYDEIEAIKFFRHDLKPYWRRAGATPADLFQAAERDYDSLTRRCADFDRRLLADATEVGGVDYARICALAYRQCLAGYGLAADANGQPLYFTKENTSNGDIATVDVFFPGDPLLLLVSPTLAKASLVPILAYAASDHWKFPNAPHDLGTYPIARGTDSGGEAMPVEESGNMLILLDAVSQIDGNTHFADTWWLKISQWAKFLDQYGLDPENQLCTDDFMGHLAHNANLSVKAIVALGAYGDMCRLRGDASEADRYAKLAHEDANHWMQVDADGNHYRLAFDKPDTWSQKYNLVWDKVLQLHVFPPEVAAQEIAYYKTVLQPFGLPLDSRTKLTKTDWTLWTATLADNQADFTTLIAPICKYLDQTTARQPFVDSYHTDDPAKGGFHARPVIGGVFIKMLADRAIWMKWAHADHNPAGPWALLPPRPKIAEVVPTSQHQAQTWAYTTDAPPADWTQPGFDDSAWARGPAGFGNNGAHHTDWSTPDIWLRRTVTLPAGSYHNLQFYLWHDDDVEIYVNGVLAARQPGYVTQYETLAIKPGAADLLKPGATVTLCVHCHQYKGGQGIDVGVADVTE